jgi:hypothetical protein
MADTMKDFCDYFAEKLELTNKSGLQNQKNPIEVLGFFSKKTLKLTVFLKPLDLLRQYNSIILLSSRFSS